MSDFDDLLADLDPAMLIVTVADGQARDGCLVGFSAQVSIDPTRFIVCLSDVNRTYRLARGAEHLGVHVLPAARADLAELFGGETGDDEDKLAQVPWHEGPRGVPLLDGCPDRFVGRIVDRVPFGDHVGHVLEPVAVEHGEASAPLRLGGAQGIEPGHPA